MTNDDRASPGHPLTRFLETNAKLAVGQHLLVQRFIDRRHFYTASSITAHFASSDTGDELVDAQGSKGGTAFIMHCPNIGAPTLGVGTIFFVTNRHVLDYNCKPPNGEVIESAALKRVNIRGFAQPQNLSQPPIPWTYTHEGVSGITFHHDGSTDLAVIRAQRVDFQPWQVFTLNMVLGQAPNHFDTKLLAVESEIDLLTPGEQVLIVGYPGIRGVPERRVLFNGIICSDPRYPAMFGETTFENSVLCHSFSWGGMSGAPVLGFSEAIGQTKIIGINAGHIGGTGNFGGGVISHFVKSSALVEIFEELIHDGASNDGPGV